MQGFQKHGPSDRRDNDKKGKFSRLLSFHPKEEGQGDCRSGAGNARYNSNPLDESDGQGLKYSDADSFRPAGIRLDKFCKEEQKCRKEESDPQEGQISFEKMLKEILKEKTNEGCRDGGGDDEEE